MINVKFTSDREILSGFEDDLVVEKKRKQKILISIQCDSLFVYFIIKKQNETSYNYRQYNNALCKRYIEALIKRETDTDR